MGPNNLKLPILFFILLLFVFPAHADYVSDAAANSVKNGAGMALRGVGDAMIQLGTGSSTVNRSNVSEAIFSTVTYTVDPYQYQWVKDWWVTFIIVYTILAVIALLMGAILVMLSRYFPSKFERMAWIIGGGGGAGTGVFNFQKWTSTIGLAIILPYVAVFGTYVLLIFNFALTGLMTNHVMYTIPPTSDNIIAYLIMAIAYLIIGLLLAARNIILVLFAAGSIGIAALFLLPQCRDFVGRLFKYFIGLIFMQPIIIFAMAVGFTFINALPPVFFIGQFLLSIVMVLILLRIADYFVTGGMLTSSLTGKR
jgi:hypothetical protein